MNEIQLNDRTNKRNYELEDLGIQYNYNGNLKYHNKGGFIEINSISRQVDIWKY